MCEFSCRYFDRTNLPKHSKQNHSEDFTKTSADNSVDSCTNNSVRASIDNSTDASAFITVDHPRNTSIFRRNRWIAWQTSFLNWQTAFSLSWECIFAIVDKLIKYESIVLRTSKQWQLQPIWGGEIIAVSKVIEIVSAPWTVRSFWALWKSIKFRQNEKPFSYWWTKKYYNNKNSNENNRCEQLK